jgi:hypothetical protein
MKALAFIDGEWAGPAEAHERTGTIKMTQTERVDGAKKRTFQMAVKRSGNSKWPAGTLVPR